MECQRVTSSRYLSDGHGPTWGGEVFFRLTPVGGQYLLNLLQGNWWLLPTNPPASYQWDTPSWPGYMATNQEDFTVNPSKTCHVISVCIVCTMFIPSVPNDKNPIHAALAPGPLGIPSVLFPGRSSPCLVVTAQATQFLMFPIKIARTATD